jgi:acyl-CoA synthetase (NDP forming)
VKSLLRPASIVIVGASERSRWSRTAYDNLTQSGFAGEIHLVNPRGGMVHGKAAATNAAAIGAQVDLAIVLVPAPVVAEAIDELGAAGVRSAVVLTSGFAETGKAGAELQAKVAESARRHGMRLLGPNSLGFINFADNVQAWTTPVRAPSKKTGIAIVSQSGATAFFLAELGYQQDLGLSYVIATGNEVDLDASAFVDYLVDDPRTRAIALFIETVRDPARFLSAARRALQQRKPIVVLKVGSSEVTARSAAAHTGALVGDDRVFDGICRQLGLIRVRSIEDLLATADIAARTGVLREGGVCIVSNSGGICEIAADTAELKGLRVPELKDTVAAQLRDSMPGFGTPHNPLDLTGGMEPEQCEQAIRLLARQPEFAAVLCAWYGIPTCKDEESPRLAQLHHHLAKGLNEAPIPGLLVSYTPTHVNEHARKLVELTQAPYLAFGLDRAIAGLAGVSWWSERQRQPRNATADAPAGEASRAPLIGTRRAAVSGAAWRAGRARHAGGRRAAGHRGGRAHRRSGRAEDRLARHRAQERHRRRGVESRRRGRGAGGLPPRHGCGANPCAGGAHRGRARFPHEGARYRAARRPVARSAMGTGAGGRPGRRMGGGAGGRLAACPAGRRERNPQDAHRASRRQACLPGSAASRPPTWTRSPRRLPPSRRRRCVLVRSWPRWM